MEQRRWWFICLAMLATAFAWAAAVATADESKLPNVVIIYADDLGYGDLGVQNPDSKIPTPNLDHFASESLRFTDAHSSSGICTPSRYAMLTGRYHWRKMHRIVPIWGDSVFDPERLTLPEMLKQRGYATACVGKWHLGFNWSTNRKPEAIPLRVGRHTTWSADAYDWTKPVPGGPLDHGFDYYFGDDVPNFPPYTWIENDRILEAPSVPYKPMPRPSEGNVEGRPGPMVAGWRQDVVMPTLTRRAIAWLNQQSQRDKPFFLYFPWTSPHAPIVPTEDWQGATEAGGYGDFVAQSDHHFGEVIQALDQLGLRENTIVIFSSDNGPERYAFARERKFQHRSSGELRGLKRDIWEGGHRVPFMIRWPGVVSANTVTDELMSQIDIMATMAEIVDFELPPNAADDSHNQLAMWKGGKSARTSLVHNTKQDHYAIRQGDWVLIDAPSGQISQAPEWYAEEYAVNPHPGALFDLTEDLGQRKNRFAEQPERVERMRALLEQAREHGEVR